MSEVRSACTIHVDGQTYTGKPNQALVEFLAARDVNLGALRTCDTCWVRVNGKLVRGCELQTFDGLKVSMQDQVATTARHEGMEPLGDPRPDWRILTDVAARMGHDWGYQHPSEIMAEAAHIADMFAGVSYEPLVGFLRGQRFNVYSRPERIRGLDYKEIERTARFHAEDLEPGGIQDDRTARA